jgi:hypothetical protein
MSRSAKVIAEFGGDEREFCIRIGELRELQEKCEVGPGVVLMRLIANQFRVDDIPTVIRLGLIGGGLDPTSASRLVRTYVEQRTFEWGGENGLGILAVKILAAALNGAEDEPPGKGGEIRNGSTISPTVRSDLDPSSAQPS